MKILIIALVTGVVILAALAGNIMSNVEQADYKLVRSKENIEIRDYSPMILAEVEVSAERKQAIKQGFRILADYIFGNNTSNKKIDMTAPVIQEQYTGGWKIGFVMPKKYTLETLPKPNSKDVVLLSLSTRRFVTIRFSGLADDENIKQHIENLEAYILVEKLKPIGGIVLAFYNPPWTLPFLRHNEVMIEIGVEQ